MDPDPSPVSLGYALHARLVAEDSTAAAEIAEIFLPLLLHRLKRNNPAETDPHLVEQSCHEALFSYLLNPHQYKPELLSLLAYLGMAAQGDYSNARARAQRIHKRETEYPRPVADQDDEAEHEPRSTRTEDDVLREVLIALSPVPAQLDTMFPDPTDRYVVELIIEGVRSTRPYAIVLQITHLSHEEQREVVKRCKDRIKVRIRRTMDATALRVEAAQYD